MWLNLVTPPAEQPLTLAETKAHLRVLHDLEDAMITSLIATATAHLEGRQGILGRALVTQTWETRLDCWPRKHGGRIELPFPPLQSVVSVKYLDTAGVEQTLVQGTDYIVDAQHMIGRIRPAYQRIWPAALDDEGAVRIQFVAGYGNAAAVPAPIKQAMLLLIGHWWINREAVGQTGGPHALAVESLTFPYRISP